MDNVSHEKKKEFCNGEKGAGTYHYLEGNENKNGVQTSLFI